MAMSYIFDLSEKSKLEWSEVSKLEKHRNPQVLKEKGVNGNALRWLISLGEDSEFPS